MSVLGFGAELTLRGALDLCRHQLGPGRHRRTLARLHELGFLSRPPRGTPPDAIVRLTESGRVALLGGRDLEACWARAWDGIWRLVIFDVAERERALRGRLRRRLQTLHFGRLQFSAWLSPDSADEIRAVTAEAEIDPGSFTLLEVTAKAGLTDADLVAHAWRFDRINQPYEAYLRFLRSARKMTRGQRAAWLQEEAKLWARAVSRDPLLPRALLPAGYLGQEAFAARRSALSGLLS